MVTQYFVVRPRQIVEEIVITELQFKRIEAGEALVQYDVVYQDGLLIKKSNATNTDKMDAIGLMNAAAALGILGDVIFRGRITNTSWSWTSGAYLFASTTGGEMTETPPTASGNVSQQMAKALTPTLIEVNPQLGYMIGK